MPLKAPYILALCEAAQQPEVVVPFGVVIQIGGPRGGQGTSYTFGALCLIQSIVLHSLARETVATEFLKEFHEVSCLKDIGSVPLLSEFSPLADRVPVAPLLDAEAEADANQWADSVVKALHSLTEDQISTELKPVLNLASDYLSHLILAGLCYLYQI
jgi:hypothetical protein